jgi:hypothetical protein
MLTCIICRFATELDDAITATPSGRCLCLRCYTRETGTGRPMPRTLQRDLIATLRQLDQAA